jgi:hypothetical protein
VSAISDNSLTPLAAQRGTNPLTGCGTLVSSYGRHVGPHGPAKGLMAMQFIRVAIRNPRWLLAAARVGLDTLLGKNNWESHDDGLKAAARKVWRRLSPVQRVEP